jgi:hypothetical protein
VAVLLGAVVVLTAANALSSWFGIDQLLPAFGLGIFAAGWNTKARSIRSWIVVAILTAGTAIVIAFVLLATA